MLGQAAMATAEGAGPGVDVGRGMGADCVSEEISTGLLLEGVVQRADGDNGTCHLLQC